ncbi:MAG TPA: hypothetical protein VE075_01970 [Thermoanaerobaculia bacterium]|nr:hypothetical protein [Thermoanaerobaculia bacterium]
MRDTVFSRNACTVSSRHLCTAAATALLAACILGGPAFAQAPGVQWHRADWFPYSTPLTTVYQTQDASGEDWWNNHANSYDGTNTLQGYVMAGYSKFLNYAPQELPAGCLNLHVDPPSCDEFESPGHVSGPPHGTLALIDPSGSFYYWFQAYDEGEFFRVIQTSDGGYLATGYTGSTRTLDGTMPLAYNPGQTAGQLQDSFGPGNGCTAVGGGQTHATLLKVDAMGNVQWHYLYGMQPYRDAFGNPDADDAYAATGEGWGLVEAANGNFILVGQVVDPLTAYTCGGLNLLSRAFMIEVTPQGTWVSGKFLQPAATLPTTAFAITKYQDPSAAFHYVVSGTELFQSNVSGAFNGYTGCGLYQKVFAQQLDDTPGRALEWDVTDFNNTSSLFQTSSQNTYDVQIASYSTYAAGSYTSHTDILLPAIVDCTGCLYSGFNAGTGMVFRLATTGSGSTPGSQLGTAATLPQTLTAFDLRMRVTPTPDGGFAAVSTVQPTAPSVLGIPPFPPGCSFDTREWNTDAYVARFGPANNPLWDTPIPNVEPAIPTIWPSDWRFKECVYSISQSQDGGFVVSGNDSYNLEDDYMAKLAPEAPPTGANAPGLIIRDTPLDGGLEPNPDTGPMWISSDIWVRLLADGGTVHQNPTYAGPNTQNYVYARITNLSAVTQTATLNIYWAKASTGLSWPTQWVNYHVGGTLFGDLIGSISVTVPPNTSMVIPTPMTWFVPNPADFVSFGADQSHFCLLARILTQPGSFPYGMTYPETADVYFNTRNNDKIAWKNVSVVVAGHMISTQFVGVANPLRQAALIRLAFSASKAGPRGSLKTLLDYGTVDVSLGPDLFQRWVRGGRVGRGVKVLRGQRLRLLEPNAWIGNIRFGPGEMKVISAGIHLVSQPFETEELDFDVLQYSTVRRREKLVGGQRFALPIESHFVP